MYVKMRKYVTKEGQGLQEYKQARCGGSYLYSQFLEG